MRWQTKRWSNEASKHHAALLLAYLNPLCTPITASFEHCSQWVEGGIVIFYTKKLINVALVDEQLTH
eukprot:14091151-Ditylum_brightwellii.AAC.1